ncbi:hypothetical protein Tco_0787816 [Tanacetum coccineum]
MTDVDQSGADQHNVSQESRFEQEEEDAHVTLTAIHDTQKTEGPMQSSYVSSDFTKKLLNFKNVSPTNNEISSMMDNTIRHEEPSGQTSTLYIVPVTQVDQYAQAISLIPAIIDRYIDNKQREAIQQAIQSHTAECREEALADRREYIDLIDTSRNVIESLEVVVLAKSSSQPKSSYKAVALLSEFELTKILMDMMEEHKSYLRADYKRELYDALVKSYNIDKDLFELYGDVFTLKRSRDEKDKDQHPSTRSDQGTKIRKSSTSRSQHKSSGKSTHAEEPSHIVDNSGVQKNQEFDTSKNDEQPDDEAAPKFVWYKKPEQPPTPNPD